MNMISGTAAKYAELPFASVLSIAKQQSASVGVLGGIVQGKLTKAGASPACEGSKATPSRTIDEQLFDARVKLKVSVSQVAMHLSDEWRKKLFVQLDDLLDAEQWESDDTPPKLPSFRTFLRMLLLLKSEVRPGIGLTHDGKMVAAWTKGEDRLTVECSDRDRVQWSLATTIDGERVRAAGQDTVARLPAVLTPYQPQKWFRRA